jgi:hypothetical protein
MEAMTFRQALEVAQAPKSRFFFGSPCRFIPRVDFTCHMLVPSLLRKGDTTQLSLWDQGRVFLSLRLMQTSPRWQWLVGQLEWSMA